MKKVTLLIILLYACKISFAQNARVKGTVKDLRTGQKIENVVIAVLRAKDSILLKYSRSMADGTFSINNLKAGTIIIVCSYSGYADYVEMLKLNDTSVVELHEVPMSQKAKLLEEVIVTHNIGAIRIKGDTTEYKADSFHLPQNATVEELLTKLPGIQVDRNGQITAQGQKVKKVLVDGEEFFGDDPTLVTRNLRADIVDKIQIFDKKSDQAAFTGIDDGKKDKTINVKLKEDKKNGFFGKINAGLGESGYTDNQATFNKFHNKEKFAVFGIVSNTGNSGLNQQDDEDNGNSALLYENGIEKLSTWSGRYDAQGYPSVQTGGIHYDNKWDKKNQSLNTNYKIFDLQVKGNSTVSTQTAVPGGLLYSSQQQRFNNRVVRNKADGAYEIKLDSTSSLKFNLNASLSKKESDNVYYSEVHEGDSLLMNNGNRNVQFEEINKYFNGTLLWRKRLKKKGRTISLNTTAAQINSNARGYLLATYNFYDHSSTPVQVQTSDQQKTDDYQEGFFDSKITYTEPLAKDLYTIISYNVNVNAARFTRETFNKSVSGKYDLFDSLYSNEYAFNILTQKGGLNFSVNKKKVVCTFGSDISFINYAQINKAKNTSIYRSFINWLPQASFNYVPNTRTSLAISYNGSTRQPSMQQIQPVTTNTDPVNIAIGNATLKPSFAQGIRFTFIKFQPLSGTNLWTSASYNLTNNAISTNTSIDSQGKKQYQFININGCHSINGMINYGFKWKKAGLNIIANITANENRYINIINEKMNVTNSSSHSFGLRFGKSKEKRYDWYVSNSLVYTKTVSSVEKDNATRYWSYNIQPNLDIFLPARFQVHTDCNLMVMEHVRAFDNNKVILWNGWIGKKVFKNEALLLKATLNDILNSNPGINRMISENYFMERRYDAIRRYFLMSVTWNFNKNGGK